MRRLSLLALLLALVTGCASQPPYIDNGHTGQIKAVIFYDDNKNGIMDGKEAGVQGKVAITQEVSCPPTGKPDWVDTDASGVYLSAQLKPGKYCIFPFGNWSMTTRATQEVYVSSDQVTTVAFGVLAP